MLLGTDLAVDGNVSPAHPPLKKEQHRLLTLLLLVARISHQESCTPLILFPVPTSFSPPLLCLHRWRGIASPNATQRLDTCQDMPIPRRCDPVLAVSAPRVSRLGACFLRGNRRGKKL